MKIKLCIAIFVLSLAGGVASACIASFQPAHADVCGGYACQG
jgi:ribosomal protein S12 methylthiotransferase accessory factor YcaO